MVLRSLYYKKGTGLIKLVVALLLWWVATTYLIHFYGPHLNMAFMDTNIHTLLLLLGFLLLENVFRFYLPRQTYSWLCAAFPLILTLVVAYTGDYLLHYLYGNQSDYQIFLDHAFFVRGFILLLLFNGFTLLMVFYARLEDQMKTLGRKEMIEKMSKESELYHLRQQLQPHFMFNSLNSISALIHRSPEKAREMVLQLSEFLRGTIRKEDKKWVAVKEELNYLQLFLDIERVRFGHRLQVDFQVEKEAEKLKIPPLMIQPLLENAVKHGLYGVIGEVLISINIKKRENYLEIVISNPFDPGSGKAEGTGFGLDAVTRRLYLLFGRHDLFHCSPQENLFTVWLRIPQNYDQDPNN